MVQASKLTFMGMEKIGILTAAAALCLAGCAQVEVGAEAVKSINKSITEANTGAGTGVKPASGSRIDQRLEPAPELFEARGLAVWDGARTLQGIWVAHPQAETARRVRIFDTATRRAVDGALFRRDKAISGSSVLISSEAAVELGLSPNKRAQLLIVALKPSTQAAKAVLPETSEDEVETAQIPAATDVDEAPAPETPVSEAPAPEAPVREAVPEEEAVADASESQIEETAEPVVAAAPAAEPVVETPVEVETPKPEAPVDVAETREAAPSADSTEAAPDAETASPPEPAAENEQLALANDDFEWSSGQPAADPEPQPASQPAARDEPEATRPKGTLFVAAGTFGVKENADRLIKRIEAAGFPTQRRTTRQSGRSLVQVLSGPFSSAKRQREALRAIRRMGLRDALAIKG